jgi:hypothetical protein
MHTTRPQHFASIHVSHAAHHALIKQSFGNSYFRLVVMEETRSAFVQVCIWAYEVGT